MGSSNLVVNIQYPCANYSLMFLNGISFLPFLSTKNVVPGPLSLLGITHYILGVELSEGERTSGIRMTVAMSVGRDVIRMDTYSLV